MYKNGFIKVLAATPKIIVGDIENNKDEILNILNDTKASIVVFPELSVTGYTMSDLFYQDKTLNDALKALDFILKNNKHEGLATVGLPFDINGRLYNVAVIFSNNKILGVVPKYNLPNNGEFSETRWFVSGHQLNVKEVNILNQTVPFGNIIFKDHEKDINVAVEICQDLWTVKTPADDLAFLGANIILNLSASTELIGKEELRRNTVLDHSRKQMSAYVYATTGIYESSSEAIFSSHKIIASLGSIVKESPVISFEPTNVEADINITEINFQRRQDSNFKDAFVDVNSIDYQEVNFSFKESKKYEFSNEINQTPYLLKNEYEMEKVLTILTASLIKKLSSLPESARKIIIGVSGGLDSTHALIIAHNAFVKMGLPLEHIYPIIMPASSSTSKSMDDAVLLIEGLNLKPEIININESVNQHLKDLNHNEIDVTYENSQARIRTLILMNLANKYGGFVLGTGDLSEIALGFMTYNGDQMSMYAINAGLPKTTIQQLTRYYANNQLKNIKDVLIRIVDKKISPELLKDQDTEEIIGSYLINDFIMYYHLQCGLEESKLIWLISNVFKLTEEEATTYVNRFVSRFYNQQFKRSTMPEGPKVFSLSLSPRLSYKLPSDIKRK